MVRGSSCSPSCYRGPGRVRLLLQHPSTQSEFEAVAQKCRWEDMPMHFQGTNYLFVLNTQIIKYLKQVLLGGDQTATPHFFLADKIPVLFLLHDLHRKGKQS